MITYVKKLTKRNSHSIANISMIIEFIYAIAYLCILLSLSYLLTLRDLYEFTLYVSRHTRKLTFILYYDWLINEIGLTFYRSSPVRLRSIVYIYGNSVWTSRKKKFHNYLASITLACSSANLFLCFAVAETEQRKTTCVQLNANKKGLLIA